MKKLLLVTRVRGSAWNPDLPTRQQARWTEHAQFTNALVASGFVVLGGPVGAGFEILLVVDATDEAEVRRQLTGDPWTPLRLLEIKDIRPWKILLQAEDWD